MSESSQVFRSFGSADLDTLSLIPCQSHKFQQLDQCTLGLEC